MSSGRNIDWADLDAWGGVIHESDTGSWLDAEVTP